MSGSTVPRQLDYLVGGLRVSVAEGSTTPGPRSHILGALDGLRAQQVACRLFVASEQPLLGRFARMPEGSGARGPRQRVLGDVVRVLASLWSLLMVRRWSRDSTADLVYERAAVYQFLGLAHRRRRKALYVVESNGIFSRETALDRQALASPRLAALVERSLYRRADMVVVVSDRLRDEVCSFAGIPRSRTLVVPNAVPDAAFVLPRPAPSSEPTIGFSGSLVPWQRVDLLIRAAADVPGVRVEVLGDGPLLSSLQDLAASLGMSDRVRFAGRMDHGAALQRMSAWSAGYAGHVASSSASMYHSPLKVYEYAGLGLDLLTTRTADSTQLERDGVRVRYIDDEESVREAVRQHAKDPWPSASVTDATRERLRSRHSWSARMGEMLTRITSGASA